MISTYSYRNVPRIRKAVDNTADVYNVQEAFNC